MVEFKSDAPGAPKAIGPYSQVAVYNGVAYLSGQVPIDPSTGELVQGGIEAQTEQVMKNLRAVLNYVKLDFKNVIETDIWLTNLGDFQAVNAIYEKALGTHRPARATIQVAGLPKNAMIEIRMKAAVER